MLKKLTLIGISVITFSAIGYAQKNNVYAELGGAGFIPTINYERMLTDNIVARVGWGSGTGEEDHDGHDHNAQMCSEWGSVPEVCRRRDITSHVAGRGAHRRGRPTSY